MSEFNQTVDIWLFQTPQLLTAADWKTKRESIVDYITVLIERDFNRFIELLYRLDISEVKLKSLLNNTISVNSADLITDMIIERQVEKLASRQSFTHNSDVPEKDRW